jgi:hypothetical protein
MKNRKYHTVRRIKQENTTLSEELKYHTVRRIKRKNIVETETTSMPLTQKYI